MVRPPCCVDRFRVGLRHHSTRFGRFSLRIRYARFALRASICGRRSGVLAVLARSGFGSQKGWAITPSASRFFILTPEYGYVASTG